MSAFWTQAKLAELERMVEKRLSSTYIAHQLGCTRNAVIGMCCRQAITLKSKAGRPSVGVASDEEHGVTPDDGAHVSAILAAGRFLSVKPCARPA